MAGTGQIERLILTAGGSGYTSAPTVSISGGGSPTTVATATATVIAGVVVGVQLTTAGAGYTSAPTVGFTGGGGTGAAATARLAVRSYAAVADFREYLPDVRVDVASDSTVQHLLDRATGLCNDAAFGLGFAFDGYTVESRAILGPEGPRWVLPPHQLGSVRSVTLATTVLTVGIDYQIHTDADARQETLLRLAPGFTGQEAAALYGDAPLPDWSWRTASSRALWTWLGLYYDIIAAWGFGPAPPSVVEVCLQIAVNLYQSRKAGRFTNVIGAADGGPVGYEGAATPQQKAVLAQVRHQYLRRWGFA